MAREQQPELLFQIRFLACPSPDIFHTVAWDATVAIGLWAIGANRSKHKKYVCSDLSTPGRTLLCGAQLILVQGGEEVYFKVKKSTKMDKVGNDCARSTLLLFDFN